MRQFISLVKSSVKNDITRCTLRIVKINITRPTKGKYTQKFTCQIFVICITSCTNLVTSNPTYICTFYQLPEPGLIKCRIKPVWCQRTPSPLDNILVINSVFLKHGDNEMEIANINTAAQSAVMLQGLGAPPLKFFNF